MTRPAVLTLALVAAGCFTPAPTPPAPVDAGGPVGGTTWYAGADPATVPGIDAGSVAYVGRLLVVWVDAPGSTLGNPSGGDRPGEIARGGEVLAAGHRITYALRATGVDAGEATINGQVYDLARGGLFLVRTRGGVVEVRQLKRDLSGLAASGEFKAFGRADREIVEFFKGVPAPP